MFQFLEEKKISAVLLHTHTHICEQKAKELLPLCALHDFLSYNLFLSIYFLHFRLWGCFKLKSKKYLKKDTKTQHTQQHTHTLFNLLRYFKNGKRMSIMPYFFLKQTKKS